MERRELYQYTLISDNKTRLLQVGIDIEDILFLLNFASADDVFLLLDDWAITENENTEVNTICFKEDDRRMTIKRLALSKVFKS